MFGWFRRRRKSTADQIIDLRIELIESQHLIDHLRIDVRTSEVLRAAAEAEVVRLQAILTAHPIAPAAADPAKPAEPKPAPTEPRMLTGLEVVSRATLHRNAHQKAAQR